MKSYAVAGKKGACHRTNIITFYKGERSYCNNYRGIPVYIEISLSLSLLSIVGNVFVRVIMTTL